MILVYVQEKSWTKEFRSIFLLSSGVSVAEPRCLCGECCRGTKFWHSWRLRLTLGERLMWIIEFPPLIESFPVLSPWPSPVCLLLLWCFLCMGFCRLFLEWCLSPSELELRSLGTSFSLSLSNGKSWASSNLQLSSERRRLSVWPVRELKDFLVGDMLPKDALNFTAPFWLSFMLSSLLARKSMDLWLVLLDVFDVLSVIFLVRFE